ncbi:3-hydroxyacyl-CoA dehydrogenase NAD-binding domain-containing protein [Streptomyces violascens]|uniref:3-hydroxyacyl-CoA dehydrogenase NAD-binding domain-containing protein n=1 Tax=Streptomyces violascens TaxID=67381 RepID=UPI0036D0F5FE
MHPTTRPTARRTVGVVGAGTTGVGIAHCLAAAGHDVAVVDPVPPGARHRPQPAARRNPHGHPAAPGTGRRGRAHHDRVESMGKQGIAVGDAPGFGSNRHALRRAADRRSAARLSRFPEGIELRPPSRRAAMAGKRRRPPCGHGQ